MEKYEQKALNQKLKGLADEYRQEYNRLHKASYDHYLKGMKPGEVIPANKAFYDQVYEGTFYTVCTDLKEKASGLIAGALKDLKTKANAAPTPEALATVQMVAMRKNITERDINRLMEAYGDNPITYTTLKDIAAQHDIHSYSDSPVDGLFEQLNELENLQAQVERAFSPYNANQGETHIMTAAEAFKTGVDYAVPAE